MKLDKLATAEYENADIKVLMFGASRVGKSSVLARMLESISSNSLSSGGKDPENYVFQDTPIKVNVPQDIPFINKSLSVMDDLYKDAKYAVRPDNQNATIQAKNVVAELATKGRNGYKIGFCDIPGELINKYLEPSEEGKAVSKQIVPLVREADVLIVVVDSPLLLEVGESFAYEGNRIKEVTKLITDCYKVKGVNESEKYKMVLFVPVKCEVYFDKDIQQLELIPNLADEQRQMRRLFDRIKFYYKPVFEHLDANKAYVDTFIMPILTLGNIRFSSFRDIGSGEVNGDNMVLSYIRNSNGQNPVSPAPRYCYWPAIFTLLFAIAKAKKVSEERKGIFEIIKKWIRGMVNDKELIASVETIIDNIKNRDIDNSPFFFETIQSTLLEETFPSIDKLKKKNQQIK